MSFSGRFFRTRSVIPSAVERLAIVGSARVDVVVAIDGEGDLVVVVAVHAEDAANDFLRAHLRRNVADDRAFFAQRDVEFLSEDERGLPLALAGAAASRRR